VKVEHGRIIVDPGTFNMYGLGSIQLDCHTTSIDDELSTGTYSVIYQATIREFQQYHDTLARIQRVREKISSSSREYTSLVLH
jgi:hypothetical protein